MGSYIAAHWRGQLSLARSYWVNVFLLSMPLTIAMTPLVKWEGIGRSLTVAVALFISLILFSLVIAVWQTIGCWRSARRHKAETGRKLWAWIVQAVLILGAALAIWELRSVYLVGAELVRVVLRTDDLQASRSMCRTVSRQSSSSIPKSIACS